MQAFPRPTKTYHTTAYDRIIKHHGFVATGKTILITGGASGIGYSFAHAFASTGVARIAIVSRSPGPQEKAKRDLESTSPSTEVLPFQASVTDNARMIEILKELGTVDVLVLNAAVAHRRATATDITTEEMQDAFDTNVIAAFNLAGAYLNMPPPAADAAGPKKKTIINVSAAAAHLPGPFRVGYGSSKAAAVQVMQSFASQYHDADDVRIFSIHPGSLYTPGAAQNIPKDRMKWDDLSLLAYFAVWLAGPESGFLHGRFVWANWDVDELIALKDRLAEDAGFLTISLIQ